MSINHKYVKVPYTDDHRMGISEITDIVVWNLRDGLEGRNIQ